MAGVLHSSGGGMEGVAADVEGEGSGRHVIVHEAGRACGGRARSYDDKQLGCRIDNGNHLFLSANKTLFRYLALTGALDTLAGPKAPIFPFVDLEEDARWTLNLSRGRMPWWVFQPHRRVPDMRLPDLRSLYALMQAGPDTTVDDCLLPGALARRLLEPLAISALNTDCATGSAALMGAVIRQSLSLGGNACIPFHARDGLSETFVDPALAHLRAVRAEVRTQSRMTGIETAQGRVTALHTAEGAIPVDAQDHVIVATPASVTRGLLENHLHGLVTPTAFESILNLHFRLDTPPQPTGSFARCGFIGVIGGIAEWVHLRCSAPSVTVRAANGHSVRSPADPARALSRAARSTEIRACLTPRPSPPL